MKSNRILASALLVLLALLFSAIALAQPPGDGKGGRHGPPGPEQRLAWLDERLDLSDEQAGEVLRILQDNEASRLARQQQWEEANRVEICAEIAATHQAILEVLDEDQATRFQEMSDKARGRGRGGRGRGPVDCSDLQSEEA